MAIGGLRAKSDLMDQFLFSQTTYDTGLKLLVRSTKRLTIFLIFEPLDGFIWLAAILSTIVIAHIIWFYERSEVNGEFSTSYL